MKTRIFKLSMPLVAFLLAIVFAFASDAQPDKADDAFVTGYIHFNSECIPVPKDCATFGTEVCTFNGLPIFAEKNGTKCRDVLYEWMP